ncbi:putative OsmC-like protein [Herbihabitans rhizosphaerae]|uniref:Putative OsmC-like protein n=1 Tax=Herbihabitans rhizosphaerae TaxID=1872711 RepID=A0A4Q7KVU4_9PSEU|nr:OsmC family protein [Herbihabitans rhizosphaerae]RZS40844.1 putative OsmC-like protein [Herbihabitans rhizosphaerae]
MAEETLRSVSMERIGHGRYRVTNRRGGTIEIGTGGRDGDEDTDFTPVELLLAAIGGCGAIDIDFITAKRAEADTFTVTVTGDKIRDESGNRMTNLAITYDIAFPDGEAGDAARGVLPRAVQQSHDRLCTVSRTVELGTPVANHIAE